MSHFKIGDASEVKILEERNAEELFQLIESCRPYLKEWLPWVDGTKSAQDTVAFIKMTQQQFTDNNGFQCAIWHEGKIAGVIGYHKIDWNNGSTSIGYWLGESFQGQGLMVRSVQALVDHALKSLGLERVEIRCGTDNKKSRAIPEALGFTNEGTLRRAERIGDRFIDLVVYGMLADDWRKSRGH